MPVRLVSETERLVWNHEDTNSGLYYRRPTTLVQREIKAKHTKKGVTDLVAVMDETIQWAALGWFGIVDQHGQEVEFSKDKIAFLPELYKNEFVAALYSLDPTVAEQGN